VTHLKTQFHTASITNK